MAEESVVFVGGCMRSGTTLVQRILCAGKGANRLLGECQYLTALLAAYRSGLQSFDLFVRDYFPTPAAFDSFNARILKTFLEEARRNLGDPRHLVFKNPELSFHFPDLAALVPKARFLLVIRDPRDTIASILEVARHHGEREVKSGLAQMGRDMRQLSDFFLRYYQPSYAQPDRLAGRLITIRYEDLIAGPEESLGLLARFTGIELDRNSLAPPGPQAMSTAWQSMEHDAQYSGAFWSENWKRAITADSVGQHRRALTADEIAAIEERCANFGRSFRYW